MMKLKQDTSRMIDNYIISNFTFSDIMSCRHTNENACTSPKHGLIFILVYSGSGKIHTNNKEYKVCRGMLISIAPFQEFTFTEASDDFHYQYMAFEFDFLSDFPLLLKPYIAEKMEKSPCQKLNTDIFKLMKGYFQQIGFQYGRIAHPSRVEIIKALLYVFIAEASSIYSTISINVKMTYKEQITDDFLKLLHAFYRKERKPQFYASQLCLSQCRLSTILKETTGQTIFVWICKFVIKEAQYLLRSTDMSISQISDKLNFPSSSYFTRYFRKYVGINPAEYRNN